MQHLETRQLRKHYSANRKRNRERAYKKFAQIRAAKERKRIERAMAEPQMPPCHIASRCRRLSRAALR